MNLLRLWPSAGIPKTPLLRGPGLATLYKSRFLLKGVAFERGTQ